MSRPALGVGVVGVGTMGAYHAANLATRVPGAHLVWVVDSSPGRAEHAATQFDFVRWSEHVEPMLADANVQAVIIATLPDTHAELVEAAASAGKAVLCEKPIADTLEDAQRAIRATQSAGVPFQIGFHRRYDPDYRAARNMVAAGELGKVQLMRSTTRGRTLDDPTRTQLWNLFRGGLIHDFDVFRYLCGAEPVELFAMGDMLVVPDFRSQIGVDTAAVTIRFDSGAIGSADCNLQCVYGFDVRAEVYGGLGMVSLGEGASTSLIHHSPGGSTIRKSHFFGDLFAAAYVQELVEFVECVRSGRTPLCTGEDGRAALAMALAAIESVQTGKPVRL